MLTDSIEPGSCDDGLIYSHQHPFHLPRPPEIDLDDSLREIQLDPGARQHQQGTQRHTNVTAMHPVGLAQPAGSTTDMNATTSAWSASRGHPNPKTAINFLKSGSAILS